MRRRRFPLEVSGDLVELLLRHQRSELGGGIEARSDLDLAGCVRDAFGELLEDGVLDVQTGTGDAALTVVEQPPVERTLDRCIEIRVGEHDVGALATELERHLLQVALGGVDDLLTHLGGTGERDLVHVVVAGQCSTCIAEAGNDVDDTGREACFFEDLREKQCGERGLLSGLEDHGVAGGKCGASFHDDMSSGKFHGTIRPQTPIASRSVYAWNSPPGEKGMDTLTVLPSILVAHPA